MDSTLDAERTAIILDCCEGISKPSSLLTLNLKASRAIKATKTNLTLCLEGISEYCRIMFDIIPELGDKSISVTTAASSVHRLNTWSLEEQSLRFIVESFSNIAPPPSVGVSRVGEALRSVISTLSEEHPPPLPSELKSSGPITRRRAIISSELPTSLPEGYSSQRGGTKSNRVRVVCIVQHRTVSISGIFDEKAFSPSEVDIGKLVGDLISKENQLAARGGRRIPIEHCDLVLLKLKEDLPRNRAYAPKVISNNLTLRVHEIDEKTIAQVFSELATIHFCLRGLRITDIPMKDSSADSRAIYEVLLLHPANDHVSQRSFEEYYNQHNSVEGVNEDEYEEETLISSTPLDNNRSLSGGSSLRCSASSAALTLKKDYLGLGRTNQLMENSMIALRWKSTDRRVDVNSLSCSCIHRVTPVNPASSPSQCLMKHMGSGRSVILQLLTTPGSGGGEPSSLLTHVLLNHGGEVYLHCLHQTPSVLDLPLSFYSKKGPSVRVRDFTTLMGITTIFPSPNPPTNSSHSTSKNSRDTHGAYQPSYVEQTEEPQQPGESPIRTPKYTTTKALERLTRYFPLLEGNTVLMDPDVSDDGKRLLDPLKTYLFRDEPDPDADADAIEITMRIRTWMTSNDVRLFPQHSSNPSLRQEYYKRLWTEIHFVAKRCGRHKLSNQMELVDSKDGTSTLPSSVSLPTTSTLLQPPSSSPPSASTPSTPNRPDSSSSFLLPQKRKLFSGESVLSVFLSKQHSKQAEKPEFDGLKQQQLSSSSSSSTVGSFGLE